MKFNLSKAIQVFGLLLFGFLFSYTILPDPEPQQQPDTGRLDSLQANYDNVILNLANLSIQHNAVLLERDSLLNIKPNEEIIDSINSIQYLGIDANIELLPELLTKEDSSFRRHIDSCKTYLHLRDK